MFSPLKPNVTFGEKDPVYWRLHRFLHWEEARRSIPRRAIRTADGSEIGGKFDKNRLIYKSKLVQAFERATLDDRIRNPAPADRQKRIRQIYAEELGLLQWLDDDSVRRPTPAQGSAHPLDLDPRPEPGNESGTKTVLDTTNDPLQGKTLKVPEDEDLPPTQRGRSKSVGKKKVHTLDEDRPSSAVGSSDPEAHQFLTRMKSRQGQSRERIKGEKHQESITTSDVNVSKLGSVEPKISEAAKATALAKLNLQAAQIVAETPKSTSRKKKQKETPKPEPKMTPHQRVLAEFRAKRRGKPKKMFVPMSKRYIKPPTERENWDKVASAISGDFNDNINWKPESRLSTRLGTMQEPGSREREDTSTSNHVYYDSSLATRSNTKLSFASVTLEPITANKKNMQKQTKPAVNSLNKHLILPPIGHSPATRHSTVGVGQSSGASRVDPHGASSKKTAPVFGASCDIAVNTICEASINTDVEQRNVGVSTRDDVVYIYETVEVNKRHRHYQKKHQKHGTKRRHGQRTGSRSTSSSTHSSRSSSTESSSYHDKGAKRTRHRTGESFSSSKSESLSRSSSSLSSISTTSEKRSDTSLRATPRSKKHSSRVRHDVEKHRQRNTAHHRQHHYHHHHNEKRNRRHKNREKINKMPSAAARRRSLTSAASSKQNDGNEDSKPEKVVAFTVRSWSGRTRRMTYVTEDLEGNSVETIRNKILNEVGIPKDVTQVTLTSRGGGGSGNQRRRSSVDASGSVEELRKQRNLDKLGRRMSIQPPQPPTAKEKLARRTLSSSGSTVSDNTPRNNLSKPGQASSSSESRRRQSLTKVASLPTDAVIGATVPGLKVAQQQKVPKIIEEVVEESEEEEVETSGQESKPVSVLSSRQKSNISSRRSSIPKVYVEPPSPSQDEQQDFEDCRYCGRRFNLNRLEIHEAVCFKTKRGAAKRTVFDSRKARLSTMLANTSDRMLLEQGGKKPDKKTDKKKKPSLWRERHKAFLEQIQYAKKVSEVEKAGGDVRTLGPAPTSFTADLTPCPKCGRKFNSESIKRHVPICKAEPIAKRK